nr:chorismate-binding protein [Parvularcula dongshanensis]
MPRAWIGTFERVTPAEPPKTAAAPVPLGKSGTDARDGYERKVAEVIRRIRAGDLFQANLSRRLSASFAKEERLADALFARLCDARAADYAALLQTEEGAVLSNSPELFLRVEGSRVTAEPIKGTRPRGGTDDEDRALAAALASDPKDRAENVMIADLLRNDLSKVARDRSVEAGPVCALRTLPHVHHLYSRITAELRPGLGPVDALEAAFPCGSVTGAPKPEALSVIAALEGEGRGPYCGTVFAISKDRAVFSVPIRTGVLTYGARMARLDVRAGGGVTVLSDPAAEWAETEAKAYPFRAMAGPG